MRRRSIGSRLVLWSSAFALVLKAAVPLLAATAAEMRGVGVAEVCSIYGVGLESHDQGHEHHAHHGAHHGRHDHGHDDSHGSSAHTGDHCNLTALAALAVPAPPSLGVPRADGIEPQRIGVRRVAFRDASAAWAASRTRGPPRSPDLPTSSLG